ncbi:MAG: class I SAM-dependent methyltransferase [Rhodoferax sp.]
MMDSAEFDKFAEEYSTMHGDSIRASGEGPEYFAEYKVRDVARHLAAHEISAQKVLDFGCGIGGSVPCFRQHLANSQLTCVDVSQKSLDIAKSRFPAAALYQLFDGETLPFEDGTFDVIFTACVFHHIPADEHVPLLSELRRVLAPDGVFFVFEHNPLNPLTVRVVRDCPFDENAVLLSARELRTRLASAQFTSIKCRYRIFFPRVLRVLRHLENILGWCPLGAQYYLTARK